MRGPQFEANDMRKGDDFQVQMEAVNNVMFDYERSGSRYTTGVEDHKEEAAAKGYRFQFLRNTYIGGPGKPAIEAVMKHGVHDGVRAFVDRRDLVSLSDTKGREAWVDAALAQIQDRPCFTTPAAAAQSLDELLDDVGCSHMRDSVDERIVKDVRARRFSPPIRSQEQVGGWPVLR